MIRDDEPGELSQLLFRIQNQRDENACEELWNAVFLRVVALARTRIKEHSRRIADEEDIALSAINRVRSAERAVRAMKSRGLFKA